MSWQERGNKSYYYVKHRNRDGLRHEYHGTGIRGRIAEDIVLAGRAKRAAAVKAVRDYWARFERGRSLMKELDARCRRLNEASWLAAGYWRSNGYQWRRRRGAVNMENDQMDINVTSPQDLDELLEAARRGDDRACGALAAKLATNLPIWSGSLDVAAQSEQAIFDRLTDWDSTLSGTLRRQFEAMKGELAGASPTPQMQMLASWTAQSWLLGCEADKVYIEAAGFKWSFAVEALKNMNTAHDRLIEAIMDLALERTRLMPVANSRGTLEAFPRKQGKATVAGSSARPIPGPAIEPRARGLLDLASRSEQSWIGLIVGENRKVGEALSLELSSLKARLGGSASDLLECMLVDRIVMSLLILMYMDISGAELETCDQRLGSHALNRMNSAQRWFLAAVKALVKLRRLRAPALGSVEPRPTASRPTLTGSSAGSRARPRFSSCDHEIERFLRVARPGEDAPCSRPGSLLSLSYGQPISGFYIDRYSEYVWINRIAGQDQEVKEKLIQHIKAVKRELLRPDPSQFELLLVHRIVICQLQTLFAGSIVQSTMDFSDDQANYARRCMDAAHKRERILTREYTALRKLLDPGSKSVGSQYSCPGLKQQSFSSDPLVRSGELQDPATWYPETASGEAAAADVVPVPRRGRTRRAAKTEN